MNWLNKHIFVIAALISCVVSIVVDNLFAFITSLCLVIDSLYIIRLEKGKNDADKER